MNTPGGTSAKLIPSGVVTCSGTLYPVTQREYRQLMGQNPSSFTTQEGEEHDWHPVVNMSWHDASAFCDRFAERSLWPVELDDWSRAASNAKKLACRLPTEAQWEYAGRGGAQGAFCFGNDESRLVHYAWFGRNAMGRTHRVGRREPNSLGLHDMHGNVWEWCHDWYRRDYYARSPRRNPYGPATGTDRVLRGGAFQDDSSTCRAARRYADVPDFSGSNKYGFRVLIDLDAHDLQISHFPAHTPQTVQALIYSRWRRPKHCSKSLALAPLSRT